MKILLFIFVVVVNGSASLALPVSTLKATEVLSGKIQEVKPKASGTVVVFLSASCPCSHSHVEELKSLATEFPQFAFVGVHSNADEDLASTKDYFEKRHLNFPVLQDDKAKIADDFKALKTPHAFVLSAEGKILYQGGVSSSRDISKADRKFLREALNDLKENHEVKTPEGRTLGCTISRGEKNVW